MRRVPWRLCLAVLAVAACGGGVDGASSDLSLELLAGDIHGPGSVDGTGAAAYFNDPTGVVADGAGNVYVADAGNHTLRKVTPAGVVTTLAGTAGMPDSADGVGAAARFNTPIGIAIDSAGNLYVADTVNHTLRKITPAGVVTTLAGVAQVSGSADGTGPSARFYLPAHVAVDGAGNLYVTEFGNSTIRKVTTAGVVTTLAGTAGMLGSADGTGPTARFHTPSGIAIDSAGNLYVADQGNGTLRKVTPAGVVTTLAGTAGAFGNADGTGSTARFTGPADVAIDGAGKLYVVDVLSSILRTVTPSGTVATLAGSVPVSGSADGTGSTARFNFPLGVAVDSAGTVYVADTSNHALRKVTSAGVVTTLAGTPATPGSADGTGSAARFNFPNGVAVDSAGTLYVADTSNDTIRKVTSAGVATTLAGTPATPGSADGTGSAARFNIPTGVAVDSAGTLYVADNSNHTIRKVTSGGVVTTLAGTPATPGSADGTGSAARFDFPNGLAVDRAGTLYVADTANHTIRKITPAGVVTTLAGTPEALGSADGTGSAARFHGPTSVAVDSAGNVYVADQLNSTIRKITPTGVTTTVAGTAGMAGIVLGTTPRFGFPRHLAISGDSLVVSEPNAILLLRHGARSP